FYEKICYFGGFAVVMLIGFVILLATGQLTLILVIGSLAVFAMIAFVLVVLIMSKSHEAALLKMMFWIELKVNWFMTKIHKKPIKPWAERICGSFHDASVIAFQKPRTLISMFARMVGLHLFDCACFIFSAMAFGVFDTFGFSCIPFLIATYVAGFVIATFIPQTFGLVEVAIAEILVAYGCADGAAYAIAICYRGLIFWIPFAIGAICINITGKFDEEQKSTRVTSQVESLEREKEKILAEEDATNSTNESVEATVLPNELDL
ncbi:MAG: flippase-like domain-containing protein, partial [Clostridia bacterium]|nr:flippase-like domain-containing protein [Clostridia bacterium]